MLWWLGQSGWIPKSPAGQVIAINPYLTNARKAVGDAASINLDRMVPTMLAPDDLMGIDMKPHGHEEHLDRETLPPYRAAACAAGFVAPCGTRRKHPDIGACWSNLAQNCVMNQSR